jgi:hypothetical protein
MVHVPFNRSALAYPTVRKNMTAAGTVAPHHQNGISTLDMEEAQQDWLDRHHCCTGGFSGWLTLAAGTASQED